MRYSVIIPVYNRPDEVDELLQSLTAQHFKDFEVVVVEDGSAVPCEKIVNQYQGKLDIHYYNKPNSGPGQTRNYGAERSNGEYLIILDSDCILPEGYLDAVEKELQTAPADAFGGPDRAHSSFTDIQKAINYSMTSFFTTGGIRGGKKKMDKCRLFPDAWVYHKRRTDFKKFFKQVHNSGIARINLYKKYPESLKVVHLLPAVFTLGVALLLLCTPFCLFSLVPILLYALLVCLDSALQNKSLRIGIYSIAASFIQLIGYGTGFWRAWWERCILGRNEFEAFRKNFYK